MVRVTDGGAGTVSGSEGEPQELRVYKYSLGSKVLNVFLSCFGFGFAALWAWNPPPTRGSYRHWLTGLTIGILFGLWFLIWNIELYSTLHLSSRTLVKVRPLGLPSTSVTLTENTDMWECRPLIGAWGWMLQKVCITAGSEGVSFDARLVNYSDLKRRLHALIQCPRANHDDTGVRLQSSMR